MYFDTEQAKQASQNYYARLEMVVRSSRVVVAAIGPSWLTVSGPDGTPKLFYPGDVVAFELRTALTAQIAVVPVLFDGATVPPAHHLPQELGVLQRLDAVEMTHARWQDDLRRVVSALRDVTGLPVIQPSGPETHHAKVTKVPAGWEWRGYLTLPPSQARSHIVAAIQEASARHVREVAPGSLTTSYIKFVFPNQIDITIAAAYGGTRTTNVHVVCGSPYGQHGSVFRAIDAVTTRGAYRKTIEQIIDHLARTGYLGD